MLYFQETRKLKVHHIRTCLHVFKGALSQILTDFEQPFLADLQEPGRPQAKTLQAGTSPWASPPG